MLSWSHFSEKALRQDTHARLRDIHSFYDLCILFVLPDLLPDQLLICRQMPQPVIPGTADTDSGSLSENMVKHPFDCIAEVPIFFFFCSLRSCSRKMLHLFQFLQICFPFLCLIFIIHREIPRSLCKFPSSVSFLLSAFFFLPSTTAVFLAGATIPPPV